MITAVTAPITRTVTNTAYASASAGASPGSILGPMQGSLPLQASDPALLRKKEPRLDDAGFQDIL